VVQVIANVAKIANIAALNDTNTPAPHVGKIRAISDAVSPIRNKVQERERLLSLLGRLINDLAGWYDSNTSSDDINNNLKTFVDDFENVMVGSTKINDGKTVGDNGGVLTADILDYDLDQLSDHINDQIGLVDELKRKVTALLREL